MAPLDLYEVLEDADHPVFQDLGRLLYSLVLSQPSWVFRRVDTATFINVSDFRRHMSVDCRVPPEVVQLAGELGLDRFPVPLRFVLRGMLAFDLRLDGKPVPLLTRSQNIMATRALLQAAVEQVGVEPDQGIQELLARVANADERAADEALNRLGVSPKPPEDSEKIEEDFLRWMVKTFDRNHLVLGDVPLEVIGHRVVFKTTQQRAGVYRTSGHLFDKAPVQDDDSRALASLRARMRTMLRRIGWTPEPLVFDTPDVTTTASYHFQIIPPNGLAFRDGVLLANHAQQGPIPIGYRALQELSHTYGVNVRSEDVPAADGYAAVVYVRPSPDGLLRASAWSAGLSTVLLLAAAAMADRVDLETQVGPATALLLVIPGALSTFLARPGEHTLVARMLRGIRGLTLASAITTYLAAALLVLDLPNPTLRTGWLLLGLASAFPALLLSVAVRRCRSPG